MHVHGSLLVLLVLSCIQRISTGSVHHIIVPGSPNCNSDPDTWNASPLSENSEVGLVGQRQWLDQDGRCVYSFNSTRWGIASDILFQNQLDLTDIEMSLTFRYPDWINPGVTGTGGITGGAGLAINYATTDDPDYLFVKMYQWQQFHLVRISKCTDCTSFKYNEIASANDQTGTSFGIDYSTTEYITMNVSIHDNVMNIVLNGNLINVAAGQPDTSLGLSLDRGSIGLIGFNVNMTVKQLTFTNPPTAEPTTEPSADLTTATPTAVTPAVVPTDMSTAVPSPAPVVQSGIPSAYPTTNAPTFGKPNGFDIRVHTLFVFRFRNDIDREVGIPKILSKVTESALTAEKYVENVDGYSTDVIDDSATNDTHSWTNLTVRVSAINATQQTLLVTQYNHSLESELVDKINEESMLSVAVSEDNFIQVDIIPIYYDEDERHISETETSQVDMDVDQDGEDDDNVMLALCLAAGAVGVCVACVCCILICKLKVEKPDKGGGAGQTKGYVMQNRLERNARRDPVKAPAAELIREDSFEMQENIGWPHNQASQPKAPDARGSFVIGSYDKETKGEM